MSYTIIYCNILVDVLSAEDEDDENPEEQDDKDEEGKEDEGSKMLRM